MSFKSGFGDCPIDDGLLDWATAQRGRSIGGVTDSIESTSLLTSNGDPTTRGMTVSRSEGSPEGTGWMIKEVSSIGEDKTARTSSGGDSGVLESIESTSLPTSNGDPTAEGTTVSRIEGSPEGTGWMIKEASSIGEDKTARTSSGGDAGRLDLRMELTASGVEVLGMVPRRRSSTDLGCSSMLCLISSCSWDEVKVSMLSSCT